MMVKTKSQNETLKLRMSLGLTSFEAALITPSVPNCLVPFLSRPIKMRAEINPRPHKPVPNHKVSLKPIFSYKDSVKKKSEIQIC